MNFLLSDYPYIIAQNAIGNESAQAILDSSIELTRNTAESWNRIWDVTVNPEAGLWKAIVELGAFIAAVTIIYLAIKEGQRLIDNPSWHKLINMFAFPLGIFLCLGGNGYLLSGTIITIRSIAYFWLAKSARNNLGRY